METIGHHTCKKDGGRQYVLNNAPFLSVADPDGKIPFLGEGFYYWDYNLFQAKKWGIIHYNNSFYVFEAKLRIDDATYLDLAGNRQHMEHFARLLDRFKKKGINVQDWRIGAFIEFIKVYRRQDATIFPYQVIRAEDYLTPQNEKKYFFNDRKNFTILTARFVICFFVTNDIPLHDKSIVYESN